MVSEKRQILDKLNVAQDNFIEAQMIAESYPFVQNLIEDILEATSEVKSIVKKTDEVMPKGQTSIQESMKFMGKYHETLEGE